MGVLQRPKKWVRYYIRYLVREMEDIMERIYLTEDIRSLSDFRSNVVSFVGRVRKRIDKAC